MKKAITGATILSGNAIINNKVIVVENGLITSVQQELPQQVETINLAGKYIAPGLIDIQVNGGKRLYFSKTPTAEALHDICDSSLQYGTTYTLPCLISSPLPKILEAIDTIRSFMKAFPAKGVLGLHLEGPFLNPEKCGAHNKHIIRKPTDDELQQIISHGKGVIKIMTIAPECFTDGQLQLLFEAGIILSAGHSTLTYEQANLVFKKGIRLVTHLYNAMPALGHREPGLAGAALDNNNIFTPVVLDGAHCHYAMARLALQVKKEKMILLSDACFLGREVKVFEDELLNAHYVNGYYRNKEGNLAGAAISMWEAVQNAVLHLGVTKEEALAMGSARVACAINEESRLGKIEPGYPAKFVVCDADLSYPETLCL